MNELQMAYRRMQEIRFCPPFKLLNTPEGKRHLDACPFCQEWIEAGIGNWSLPEITSEPPSEVAPGQIWKISEKKSGWVEWKYYNPPLVLVLYETDEKTVRVALLHDEEVLASESDIPTGTGMYAEAWNTFAFSKAYLDKFIGHAKSGTVEKVIEAENTMPEPRTIIHKYFMKGEAEVAAFFALSVLGEVMKPYESPLELLESGNVDVSLPFSLPPGKNLLERVIVAKIPDDYRAMAASDDEDYIAVRLAIVSEGKLVELRETSARITLISEEGNRLIIGGKLSERIPKNADIYGKWKMEDGSLKGAFEEAMIDEEGYFRMVFKDIPEDTESKGFPCIVLCIEKENKE